jgi:formylglycine-generating enzyme required for sulfatase activity
VNTEAPSLAGVSPSVGRILARAIAKVPDDRFRNATEMRTALQTAFPQIDTGVIHFKASHLDVAEKVGVEKVWIPEGTFVMGDDDLPNNACHRVFVSKCWISKTPVTVGQFKAYCAEKGIDFSSFKAPSWGWADDHPMVNVTWQQARNFCKWAGGDLPTEAQWEKAARGTDGRKYPWGNAWEPRRLQWSSGGGLGSAGQTAPVDSHRNGESPYGCLDMAGNVWQWCLDWYAPLSTGKPDRDPTGPAAGQRRVARGGSWYGNRPDYFRCGNRFYGDPTQPSNYFGFRLAGRP